MGCGGSKSDKIEEVDKIKKPYLKAFPKGNEQTDNKNRLASDVFEEFERIVKASYQHQPEALKKQKVKHTPQSNQFVKQTFKPADTQVNQPDKDSARVQIPNQEDLHIESVSGIKVHEQDMSSHDLIPAPHPNPSETPISHNPHSSSTGPQPFPTDPQNSQEDTKTEVMSITGNYPLPKNLVEIGEMDGAESANSPIASEESRSDLDSDIEIEELNLKQNRLEKERLNQEEAMRRAAQLKIEQDQEVEAKRKKLSQIRGDANDILSKYK